MREDAAEKRPAPDFFRQLFAGDEAVAILVGGVEKIAESRGVRTQPLVFRNLAIAVRVEIRQEKRDHDGYRIGQNFTGRQPAISIFVEGAERSRSVPDLGGGDFAVMIGIKRRQHWILTHEY